MKQHRTPFGVVAAIALAMALVGLFPDVASVDAATQIQTLKPSVVQSLTLAAGETTMTTDRVVNINSDSTDPKGAPLALAVQWEEEAWQHTPYAVADEGKAAGKVSSSSDLFCDGALDLLVKPDGSLYDLQIRTDVPTSTSGLGGTSELYVLDNAPNLGAGSIKTRSRADLANLKLGGTIDNALTPPVPLNFPLQVLPYVNPDGANPWLTATLLAGSPNRPQLQCFDSPVLSTANVYGRADNSSVGTVLVKTPAGPDGLYIRWSTFLSGGDHRNGWTLRTIDVACFNLQSVDDPDNYTENNWAAWGSGAGRDDFDNDCLPENPGAGRPGEAAGTNALAAAVCGAGTLSGKLFAAGDGGTNASGAQATVNSDQDCDGLIDGVEKAYGSDLTIKDTDGDGVPDYHEMFQGTDPRDTDTDGDGFLDAQFHMGYYEPDLNRGDETFTACTSVLAPPAGGLRTGTCDLGSIDYTAVAAAGANIWTNFDNCPLDLNVDQKNTDLAKRLTASGGVDATAVDGDDNGDECDTDDDNDGLADAVEEDGYRIQLFATGGAEGSQWRCNALKTSAGANEVGVAIGETVGAGSDSGSGFITVPSASTNPDIDGDGALDGAECILGAPGGAISELAGSDPTNALSTLAVQAACAVNVDWTTDAYRLSWTFGGAVAGFVSGAICKVSIPERCGAAITAWNQYLIGTPRDDDRDGIADEYCSGAFVQQIDSDLDGLADVHQELFYRTQGIGVGPGPLDNNPDGDAFTTGNSDNDSDNDSNSGGSPPLRDGIETLYLGTGPSNRDTDNDDCTDTVEALDVGGSTGGGGRYDPTVSATDAGAVYAGANYLKTVGVHKAYTPILDLNRDGKITASDAGIVYAGAFYLAKCSTGTP